jgi:predicted phosphoribosyltransferase
VPVASPDTADALAGKADDVVTVIRPRDMRAVGLWYDDFTQTTDAEVVALLTTTSA